MEFFKRFRKDELADLDGQVLSHLRKAGSNLSKPHEIEFFLYFPTEEHAQAAAERIRPDGFDVEVKPGAQALSWLCFATKRIVPALSEMRRIRERFESVAKSLDGEYDGWGTPVVK